MYVGDSGFPHLPRSDRKTTQRSCGIGLALAMYYASGRRGVGEVMI
jgi:hypothetical protein